MTSGYKMNLNFTGMGIFIIQHGYDSDQHHPAGGV